MSVCLFEYISSFIYLSLNNLAPLFIIFVSVGIVSRIDGTLRAAHDLTAQ